MHKVEGLSILAVEDEGMVAMELEDMLDDLGHEVIGPAATVEAALSLLQASAPDVAVVDANLDGTSAKPILEALAARGVPIVLASGYEEPELRYLEIDAPLVKKPYDATDLDKALRAACRPTPNT